MKAANGRRSGVIQPRHTPSATPLPPLLCFAGARYLAQHEIDAAQRAPPCIDQSITAWAIYRMDTHLPTYLSSPLSNLDYHTTHLLLSIPYLPESQRPSPGRIFATRGRLSVYLLYFPCFPPTLKRQCILDSTLKKGGGGGGSVTLSRERDLNGAFR